MSPARSSQEQSNPTPPAHAIRTLNCLDLLAERSMTADELAAALGVHRKTVMRLLEAMRQQGWVQAETTPPDHFRLTTKIVTTAGLVLARINLPQLSQPFLASLRDSTGESTHLSVPDQGAAVHIAEVTSNQALAVATRLGERVPLNASAVGKVIAAFLPDQLEIAMKEGFKTYTDRTVIDPSQLHTEYERIRRQGYAIDDGELTPMTLCIAAPVYSSNQTLIAALGVSGPSARVSPDRIEEISALVIEQSALISSELGS